MLSSNFISGCEAQRLSQEGSVMVSQTVRHSRNAILLSLCIKISTGKAGQWVRCNCVPSHHQDLIFQNSKLCAKLISFLRNNVPSKALIQLGKPQMSNYFGKTVLWKLHKLLRLAPLKWVADLFAMNALARRRFQRNCTFFSCLMIWKEKTNKK